MRYNFKKKEETMKKYWQFLDKASTMFRKSIIANAIAFRQTPDTDKDGDSILQLIWMHDCDELTTNFYYTDKEAMKHDILAIVSIMEGENGN